MQHPYYYKPQPATNLTAMEKLYNEHPVLYWIGFIIGGGLSDFMFIQTSSFFEVFIRVISIGGLGVVTGFCTVMGSRFARTFQKTKLYIGIERFIFRISPFRGSSREDKKDDPHL